MIVIDEVTSPSRLMLGGLEEELIGRKSLAGMERVGGWSQCDCQQDLRGGCGRVGGS